MTNPFEILGVPARMDLAADELEARYLELSRKHHPDFNPGASLDVLTRSAEINDAYRTLRDPWRRAEALIRVHDPKALDATKTLCPMFLMEAMEVRESIGDCSGNGCADLEREVRAKVDQYFADVASHIDAGEIREAATLLHQSNYYRKALHELRTLTEA